MLNLEKVFESLIELSLVVIEVNWKYGGWKGWSCCIMIVFFYFVYLFLI